MPDAAGNFKGIAVPKLWPGHRDYVPPKPKPKPSKAAKASVAALLAALVCAAPAAADYQFQPSGDVAGDATHPGYVVVDWDLGAGFLIYDASASSSGLVASFLPGRIDFYRPVAFHAGASGLPRRIVRYYCRPRCHRRR